MTRANMKGMEASQRPTPSYWWMASLALTALTACEPQVLNYGQMARFSEGLARVHLAGDTLIFLYHDSSALFTTIRTCRKHDCNATLSTHATMSYFRNCAAASGEELFCLASDNEGAGELWRVSAREIERLRTLPNALAFANLGVDDQAWYLADDRATIHAFPRVAEAAERIVARAVVVGQLQDQDEYLYWGNAKPTLSSQSTELGGYRVRKDGTTKPERLVSADIAGIAVEASRFYWLDLDTSTLSSCSPADCAGTTQMLATALASPRELKLQGDTLFWLEGWAKMRDCGVELRSCSTQGCPEGTSLAVPDKLKAYVVDEAAIYGVVNQEEPSCLREPRWSLRKYLRR